VREASLESRPHLFAGTAGLVKVVGCDPDADPEAKRGHEDGEDKRMGDLPALPPNPRQTPLASALLRI